MAKVDLDAFVCVPISVELYDAISQRYPEGVSHIIDYVVNDFLDRTEDDFLAQVPGVDWGQLFLPSGTQLRTKYQGKYILAGIVDDTIIWGGEEFPSISSLANEMRNNTSNNAWKVMEIKRPNDRKWQVADRFR